MSEVLFSGSSRWKYATIRSAQVANRAFTHPDIREYNYSFFYSYLVLHGPVQAVPRLFFRSKKEFKKIAQKTVCK